MKKKKNKILAFICTLVIAFCSVLGLNFINNVDNVSADAVGTEITDLTGTRWYFNETIDFSLVNKVYYYFSCRTDGSTELFKGLYLSPSSLTIGYYSTTNLMVFVHGVWDDNVLYRYIDILDGADVTNSFLIGFLKNNAQYLGRIGDSSDSSSSSSNPVDPEPEDSSSSSSTPVDPDPEDSSSSSSTPVDPEPEDSSSSSSEPVDPPEDSSSSSSLDVPSIEVDPDILRYGIFNNAKVLVYSYISETEGVVTRYPAYDVYYFGMSFLTTYDHLSTVLPKQGVDVSSLMKVGIRILFDIPVSIAGLTSIGTVGLSDSDLQNAVWHGLAEGYKVPAAMPENVTPLAWRSVVDQFDENKWFMRVSENAPVYSNYVGLYFELSSLEILKNLSLYVPFDGGYTDGYNQGLTDGYDNGLDVGYQNGIQEGQSNGYKEGHRIGYDDGYAKGMMTGNSFVGLMTAVVQAPVTVFVGLTDFEILGYNMSSLALSLLTAALVVCVIRLFTAGGKS